MLLIDRMCRDWDKLPPTMRKAWVLKDVLNLHTCCGAFLTLIDQLQSRIPEKDYQAALPSIQEQFLLGYLDPEILHVVETTVPPANLTQVSFLRTACG